MALAALRSDAASKQTLTLAGPKAYTTKVSSSSSS
jgi:uncharacterized protein YbjT (DUF2867 family)